MIDAYEIGIQLLLQDNVSAGLAVINRGLAEVDRAIAATSANLASLVQEADKATKAVAAVRMVQPASQQQNPSVVPAEAGAGSRSDKILDSAPASDTIDNTTILDPKAETPVAPVASPSVVPFEVQDRHQVDDPIQAPMAYPAAIEAPEQVAPNHTSDNTGNHPVPSVPSVTWEQTAPATPDMPTAETRPDQRETSVPKQRDALSPVVLKGEAARQDSRVAVTASISRSRGDGVPARLREDERPDPLSAQPKTRSQATAPWSGVEQVRMTGEPTRTAERAAAPPSQTPGRNEGGGGTVMLDGRLVGQWLSDHMASEASRPPGGTSFFDPRQTPAWNISGAL